MVASALRACLFSCLIISCTLETELEYEQAVTREETIDDVWHKAKLRGVAFRAVGQEPGWLLEIANGEDIMLSSDYGQRVSHHDYVEPVIYQEERRTQYVIADPELIVEIRGEPCTDTMSGESFEVSVSIIEADRRLEGCGRALF